MSFCFVTAKRTDLPTRRVTATRDQRTDQKGSTELTEERRELDAHGKLRSRDSHKDPHKTGAKLPAMFVFVTEVRRTELSTADAINDPLKRCYSGRNRKPISNPPSSPSSSQSPNHPGRCDCLCNCVERVLLESFDLLLKPFQIRHGQDMR